MNELHAYLDGKLCGTFFEKNGQISFAYASSYEEDTPISLSMIERRKTHKNKVALPYLRGLLPDNAQALENMARKAGVSAGSAFGLLEHYGQDVAGALQLLSPGQESSDANRPSLSEQPLLDDEGFENLLWESRNLYQHKTLISAEAFRFSVAGAQPKLSLTRNGSGQWVKPGSTIATTHIIKPVDSSDTYFVKNIDIAEFLTMKAAAECGLTVVTPEIWRSEKSNITALIVPRYDRLIQDDSVLRLHQEDLLQAMGVSPDKKYQHRDGGPGIGEISQLFRRKLGIEYRGVVAEEFFKGLVFNVGVLGTDAHAKNYSLIHKGTETTLAPLYDLISAAAHISDETQAFFPMSINKKYKFIQISDEDLVLEGQRLGLEQERAEKIVYEVLTAIPVAFETAGRVSGLETTADKMLEGLGKLSAARFVSDYWN